MKSIYILGVGRNTLNILELAMDCGYEISGLIHFDSSRNSSDYFGYPIIGSFDEKLTEDFVSGKNFALSMGDLKIKKDLFNKISGLGGTLPTLIHPSSYISRFATIGAGVLIMPHSVVESESFIGDDTTVTVNSVIAHNVRIGEHNLISGNVMVGAYSTIGSLTHIGQGAVVVSGKVKKIGDNCILGAGSVLLNDMPSNTVFVGNPANFLRENPVY